MIFNSAPRCSSSAFSSTKAIASQLPSWIAPGRLNMAAICSPASLVFVLSPWLVLSTYIPISSENHNEEGQESALLYSIGALEPAEVAAFETHLHEGCSSCQDELHDFQGVATGLALAVPQHDP